MIPQTQKKRIFVLEDDPIRVLVFQRYAAKNGYELFHETDVQKAYTTYDMNKPFTAIFLDHDLDGRVYVDSSEDNTGYRFAEYLREGGDKTQTVIHSMNPVGAQNMQQVLPHADYIPFHMLRNTLLS